MRKPAVTFVLALVLATCALLVLATTVLADNWPPGI